MPNKYYITIGLEIHAELKTETKMFCSCRNVPLEDKPNKNVCPVCMAHPGTLPVLNKDAIEKMVKLGLYIGSDIADFTEWDRKHYFYPDMPKAYQLTQYKYPIISNGKINNWPLTRIHLEEDTAKSTHDQGDHTLIDFNRAGVPLAELVTEPETFEDVEVAAKSSSDFAKEYALILKTLGVGDADMSKGQMRIEVNLSVSKAKGKENYGTKVEVKNINSFKSVEDAVRYEAARHIELCEAGRASEIVQETRGFEENKRITLSQRKKEDAKDYKYFPDPDLPKLYLHNLFDLENIKSKLPKNIDEIRSELRSLEVQDEYIETLLSNFHLMNYLSLFKEEATKYHHFESDEYKKLIKLAVNYICVDINGILQKEIENKNIKLMNVENFLEILVMLSKNELSSRGAKDLILIIMTEYIDGGVSEDMRDMTVSAKIIAEERGLIQKNDKESLLKIIDLVVDKNPDQWNKLVEEFKNGNEKLVMYFVGQAMKEAKGSGNPQMFAEIIKEKLV